MADNFQRHPKILFVNEWPPDSLYLADLVRQLLKSYPPEQIAWWHSCTPQTREVSDLRVAQVFQCKLPRILLRNRLMPVTGTMIERLWVPLAARHLRRTIAKVRPDLVWVLLYRWPVLVAARALWPGAPPVHVSVWDLPDIVSSRQILGPRRCERMLQAIYRTVRQARSWDTISEAMLQELAGGAGRDDALLVNSGFEPEHVRRLQEFVEDEKVGEVIRLAYVGTIISHSSFQEVITALERMRHHLPRPVRLEFYGGRNYRRSSWFDPSWMLEHEVFSDEGLVQSLQGCSWGLVVMDLRGEDPRYSRYSFPNKIGTCLSAGVPVLGFGHPKSALAEVFDKHSVGRFTSATSANELEEFLSEALRIPRPRAFFRQAILDCAHARFDAQKTRERVWQAWGARAAAEVPSR